MRISDWSSDVCSSDLLPTVILTSIVALSRGWSLAANHQGAICGSFIAIISPVVRRNGRSPFQLSVEGLPEYLTSTEKSVSSGIGVAGVITSSIGRAHV